MERFIEIEGNSMNIKKGILGYDHYGLLYKIKIQRNIWCPTILVCDMH